VITKEEHRITDRSGSWADGRKYTDGRYCEVAVNRDQVGTALAVWCWLYQNRRLCV